MFLLVTGGSGSGKSAYAEERILGFGENARIYIATMMCFDDESRARVRRHQKMRSLKNFTTVERYTDIEGMLPDAAHRFEDCDVLLECMSNLAANEMFSEDGAGDDAFDAIARGVDALNASCRNLVVVTNEIFSDGETYDVTTMEYMKLLGHVNSHMAAAADEVIEVVCGIPVRVK